MKVASLVIGVLLMVLAGIGGIICLMLPSMTNNRVKFDEALLGLIPAVLIFLFGLIVAGIGGMLVLKARKTTAG